MKCLVMPDYFNSLMTTRPNCRCVDDIKRSIALIKLQNSVKKESYILSGVNFGQGQQCLAHQRAMQVFGRRKDTFTIFYRPFL